MKVVNLHLNHNGRGSIAFISQTITLAHLSSHCCDLAPVPRQQDPDAPQLLRAVLDVPDLVVKVPTWKREFPEINPNLNLTLTLNPKT